MDDFTFSTSNSFDAFLSDKRIRVASMKDLQGFVKVAQNQFVRKCDQELWSLEQDEDGSYYVARLVAEDGRPIKAKLK